MTFRSASGATVGRPGLYPQDHTDSFADLALAVRRLPSIALATEGSP